MMNTMLALTTIFAHAGEAHESDVAAKIHAFPWFIQLPLFLCIVGATFSLTWLITKKISTSMLTTSFVLLVIGFGSYLIAPIISILSITVGLASTLFLTLVGLESNASKNKQ